MTSVYAIADLHLSGRPPFKNMEEFGPQYTGYMEKLEAGFRSLPADSVVIVAGDTSWAIGRDEALADLRWLDSFGIKFVFTIGNHDFFWGKKGAAFMSGWGLDNGLKNVYFVDHQKLFTVGYRGFTIAAVRGVEPDTVEEGDESLPTELLPAGHREVVKKVTPRSWEKYLRRLDAALSLHPDLLVSHIPPFNRDGTPNEQTEKILVAKVKFVIYGHRHNTPATWRCNKCADGVFWVNALAERLNFVPTPIGVIDEQGIVVLSVVNEPVHIVRIPEVRP